ncbi:hypothetical protein MYBA111488_24870 [Mycobacterium basiliense]
MGVVIALTSSLISTPMDIGRDGRSKLKLVPGMSMLVDCVLPSRVKCAISGIPDPPSPCRVMGLMVMVLISPVIGSLRKPLAPMVRGIWGMVMV